MSTIKLKERPKDDPIVYERDFFSPKHNINSVRIEIRKGRYTNGKTGFFIEAFDKVPGTVSSEDTLKKAIQYGRLLAREKLSHRVKRKCVKSVLGTLLDYI